MSASSARALPNGFERSLNSVAAACLASLTDDQGKQMARHAELAKKLNIEVYFLRSAQTLAAPQQ